MHLKSYGTALRSLQAALGDPQQRLSVHVLAAASLLYRGEVCSLLTLMGLPLSPLQVAFTPGKYFNEQSDHAYGLYHMMKCRGPPNPEDDLDKHLAFDNRGALVDLQVQQLLF